MRWCYIAIGSKILHKCVRGMGFDLMNRYEIEMVAFGSSLFIHASAIYSCVCVLVSTSKLLS